jgi:DNA-binding IclR family transcriptional regulator
MPMRLKGLRANVEREAARRTAPPRRDRQVPAVTRAIAILRLLGKSETPLGVNAIARALDLVPSTCLHILRVLTAEELIAFDPQTKRYSLDVGVIALARSALHRNSFAERAQPAVDRLSRRHSVTAIGVQVVGIEHLVVVAISRAGQGLHLHTEIGSRFPALISATGRCIAAYSRLPASDIERRFRALRWDHPPSLEQWRADVEVARRVGYAVDEGNYISGVTVIAAPVLSESSVSHAVVAVGLTEQLRRAGVEQIGEELRGIAAELSTGRDREARRT